MLPRTTFAARRFARLVRARAAALADVVAVGAAVVAGADVVALDTGFGAEPLGVVLEPPLTADLMMMISAPTARMPSNPPTALVVVFLRSICSGVRYTTSRSSSENGASLSGARSGGLAKNA